MSVSMRVVLLLMAALASVTALPVEAARAAEAQLQVTARVVNRCEVELPPEPPWTNPGKGWRKWIDHRCDHPVHPRISVQPVAAQPLAVGGIDRARVGNHWLITITY